MVTNGAPASLAAEIRRHASAFETRRPFCQGKTCLTPPQSDADLGSEAELDETNVMLLVAKKRVQFFDYVAEMTFYLVARVL